MAEWKKIETNLNFWKPEKVGDEIEGEVLSRENDEQFGMQMDIKTPSGEVFRLPSHKQLQNRLREVKIGSSIKAVLVEELPPKVRGHNPTKIYDVFVKE